MKKKTKAVCENNALVVSFNNAEPPLIWRLDLERNHSFTLSLQGEAADWDLGITTAKGEFYPIARFAEREDAEDSLARVNTVLSRNRAYGSVVFKSIIAVLIFATIILVGIPVGAFYLMRDATGVLSSSMGMGAMSSAVGGAAGFAGGGSLAPSVTIQEGVPMSADDVLEAPPQ